MDGIPSDLRVKILDMTVFLLDKIEDGGMVDVDVMKAKSIDVAKIMRAKSSD